MTERWHLTPCIIITGGIPILALCGCRYNLSITPVQFMSANEVEQMQVPPSMRSCRYCPQLSAFRIEHKRVQVIY